MPYFLLIIGLVIIFISLKGNLNKQIESSPKYSFNDVLGTHIQEKEIQNLRDTIEEVFLRLNSIEDSLLLMQASKEDNTQIKEKKNTSAADVVNKEKTMNVSEDAVRDEKKNINIKIYELHDKGLDIENICSTLGLGKGEVLLRLGLRKR